MQLQIFVPLVTYPEANADGITANAVSIVARLDAKLHAMAINPDIPDVSNVLSRLLLDVAGLIENAKAESRQRGEHLLALLRQKAEEVKVEIATSATTAPIAALGDAAAMRARYFDMSLVGWEAASTTSRMVAEAVVFGSGRPMILLPSATDIAAFDHVAIAWDGSRVAARAVADAKPFLERASLVSVITVVDEKPLKEQDAGERLAVALREHGLNAQAVPVGLENCPIADTLQRTAIGKGCQLLVMGGYGHSRIRDFVLGGATEGVLTNLLMPVLLSH